MTGSAGGMAEDVTDGPLVQSITIGFRALYAATLLLALAWLATNVTQVPADSQAIVLAFGRVVDVHPSGLVVAWPRPIEEVVLLPSPDRQIALRVQQTVAAGLGGPSRDGMNNALPRNAGSFLTGDGGVVLLDTTVYFQVSDAAAYYLSRAHVEPALRRRFLASTISIAAGHPLDDFLVTRANASGFDASGLTGTEARRLALRADLLAAVNRRLSALTADGAGLGVTVARIDLQAALPPLAKAAYDGVLEAAQKADRAIAAARTDAVRSAQDADQERDRILTAALGNAAETVSAARGKTATITALEARLTPQMRPGLLDQVYRERIAAILAKVGRVTAVDARGGSRLILPGAAP